MIKTKGFRNPKNWFQDWTQDSINIFKKSKSGTKGSF
jgi:hypothetical protein